MNALLSAGGFKLMTAAKLQNSRSQIRTAGGGVALLLFVHDITPAQCDSFIISPK